MKKFLSVLWRILLPVAITGVFIAVFGVCLLNHIYYGASPSARDLFVASVMETNAGQFLARWFLPVETIAEIRSGAYVYDFSEHEQHPVAEAEPVQIVTEITPEEKNSVELSQVVGSTYRGVMLIVSDPSRVSVFTSYPFELDGRGGKLLDMSVSSGALAAVNGGAFLDLGGDMPLGIAISGGELLLGEEGTGKEYNIVGFNEDDIFVVGRMTVEQTREAKLRDAVSFSPILIRNGVAEDLSKYSNGLNPRTAIGQRADGAVLLLVIDGRQPHSLGANYNDLIDVMLDYGAVNAATLDGGSSSIMVYENEIITKCCSLYGPGRIPTCFIVK